jgi:RNA ligase (TIGR02306 family)
MGLGLAYIGRIEELLPIENADRIESATVACGVGGRWSGVVKKGDFAPGQTCTVYLQDALIPQSERLAFMQSTNWRVKMARFRGAPSECVITKCHELFGIVGEHSVGLDVTEVLGVTKYEKPIPIGMAGSPRGGFPPFIPKTDEPNYQTAAQLVEALRGQAWYATLKCDGSSTTAYQYKGEFGVCSRQLDLLETEGNVYWMVANRFGLREKLPEGIALQWETVGPGIQKNPMGLKELTGFAFSAWNIPERKYLSGIELRDLCGAIGFPVVETVASGEHFDADIEQLRRLAEGTYASGKQREGIVFRPVVEQRVGFDRLSFKVLNLLYKD